ncbi:MAG: ferredoxin [Halothermotrichaceae bacterium]
MANVEEKYPENVDGAYYVDESCIACGVCPAEAPDNFKFTDDDDHAFVYMQPENDSQKSACEDAMDACPVDAIGNDG